MSEKLSSTPNESLKPLEPEAKAEAGKLKELQEKAAKTPEVSNESLEKIKHSIEAAAISGKEYARAGEKASKPKQTFGITKHIKRDAYKRVLSKTQKQLSAPERTFSKVIHHPIVDKASDVAAKTIARPTGIMFGGIGAFIGSLLLFSISKYGGFYYNYLVFILLFAGCYILGLVVEVIYRAVTRRR